MYTFHPSDTYWIQNKVIFVSWFEFGVFLFLDILSNIYQ